MWWVIWSLIVLLKLEISSNKSLFSFYKIIMWAKFKGCLKEEVLKIPGKDGRTLWINSVHKGANDLSYY